MSRRGRCPSLVLLLAILGVFGLVRAVDGASSVLPSATTGPYYGDLDLDHPAFASRPIQLLSESADHARLLIVDEGLAFLRAIGDMPLSVVVTAGPARTGKSFLLNNLVGVPHGRDDDPVDKQPAGFKVGHNPTPQTMGVWFWGRPTVVNLGPGKGKVAQVHMDTEGFAALGSLSESYDPKLCLYSVLFASSFYYNIKGLIDMNQIKFLSTVAMFDDVFEAKFNVSFPLAPPFWILQGFAARLTKFDPPTAEGYLDYAYSRKDQSSVEGGATGVTTYNTIIDMILRKFPDQPAPRIMLMKRPHPTVDTADYELADFAFDELAPSYKRQIKKLRALIRRRAAPKTFQSFTVTGHSMSELTRRLVPAMNDVDGDAPGIIREIASLVADECAAMYRESIEELPLPAAPQELDEVHESSQSLAFTTYEEKCVGAPTLQQNTLARTALERNISVTHHFRHANNSHVSAQHCDALLRRQLEMLNRFKPGSDTYNANDDPEAIQDMLTAAVDDLRSGCHVSEEELEQKISQFQNAAGFATALVAATRSRHAVESFAKACGTVLLACLAARLAVWVFGFCITVPETIHRLLGGATAMSGLCMLVAMAHMMGMLHKAFAGVGVEVTPDELDNYFAEAASAGRRASWLLNVAADASKHVLKHVAFVMFDLSHALSALKPPMVEAAKPYLMGDVEARVDTIIYLIAAVGILFVVQALVRRSHTKLAVITVIAAGALVFCALNEARVLEWLEEAGADPDAAS